MGCDKLEELREEWYSEPDSQPETVEDVIEDELLALQVLFRSRGVTVAGGASVSVTAAEDDTVDK